MQDVLGLDEREKHANKWDFRHWVFRRAGRPCWVCGTEIVMDRQSAPA